MDAPANLDLTRLLAAWAQGDAAAFKQLLPHVYGELRRIAARYLRRERPDHTLQPTALIHEAYLRLAESGMPKWENRAHFFAIAARIMRQVLVDWARKSSARKRGGEALKVDIEHAVVVAQERGSELLMLDDALNQLATFDERGARAVEMKYFGGLSLHEIAEELAVSVPTVTRDLRASEAWLRRQMAEIAGGGSES